MSLFKKKSARANYAEEPLPELRPMEMPIVHFTAKCDAVRDVTRPCYVRGQRAIFHRWINNAHPVLPRGTELDENTRYFQFRRTEALVEYEDGTVERVWPTLVRFADGGQFKDIAWLPEEALNKETEEDSQDGEE